MWRTYNYAVKGRKHELMARPCQDKTAALAGEGGRTVTVALADGAGSVRFAEAGAECVVTKILPYLLEKFDTLYDNRDNRSAQDDLIAYLQKELDQAAHELGTDMEEMATTLLFCAVKDGRFLAGHIGDGIIAMHRPGGSELLSVPADSEFVNETVFVTDLKAVCHLRLYGGEIRDIDGFMLLSDGSANSLYDHRRHCFSIAADNIFFMSGIMVVESFRELLIDAFDNLVRKRTADDCSIALLVLPVNELSDLPLKIQMELFGVTNIGRAGRKRTEKYVRVANLARQGEGISVISRKLHLKKNMCADTCVLL